MLHQSLPNVVVTAYCDHHLLIHISIYPPQTGWQHQASLFNSTSASLPTTSHPVILSTSHLRKIFLFVTQFCVNCMKLTALIIIVYGKLFSKVPEPYPSPKLLWLTITFFPDMLFANNITYIIGKNWLCLLTC